MHKYHVYILSNFERTTLYIGVTGHLQRRMMQHCMGQGSKFCQRYNLKFLLYLEEFTDVRSAITREKQLKAWHRQWKIDLIRSVNPEMRELNIASGG